MTTLLLFIIAGVIGYYLYITLQEYLKNPISAPKAPSENVEYNFQDDPYVRLTPFDKLKTTYAGVGIRILNKFLNEGVFKDSKTHITLLQRALIENFINNACEGMPSPESAKKDLFLIIGQSEETDIADLARDFNNNTYGEYKKRLGFVALMLMLAWSDLNLNETEQELIFDVAAYLEIENQDFNELYESFMQENPKHHITEYANLFTTKSNSSPESQEPTESKEIFVNQIKSVLAKAQKLQESPKDVMNKLLDLQEAYQNLAKVGL